MSRFRTETIGGATCIHGDSREVLETFADASIDAVVCDPPYALTATAKGGAGFMGKKWDTGETAFDPAFWREVLRVLKQGGHLLAFSGTRTYHRLACAIEDAGFEIRDMTAWLYGSGFPKSLDVSKAIDKHLGCERAKVRIPAEQVRNPKATGAGRDGMTGATRPWIEKALEAGFHEAASPEAASWSGWGTALKPALEPICLARKPLESTVAANVLKHGCGGLNIDECRIGLVGGTPKPRSECKSTTDSVGGYLNSQAGELNGKGRWPANVVHDGSDDVLEAFPDAPGQQRPVTGEERAHHTQNAYGDFGRSDGGFEPREDSGSAARFFYTAKADAEDRLGSKHPTVKPVSLMRWLCTLVTPPGGVVLDPFAGTGSTGLAAIAAAAAPA